MIGPDQSVVLQSDLDAFLGHRGQSYLTQYQVIWHCSQIPPEELYQIRLRKCLMPAQPFYYLLWDPNSRFRSLSVTLICFWIRILAANIEVSDELFALFEIFITKLRALVEKSLYVISLNDFRFIWIAVHQAPALDVAIIFDLLNNLLEFLHRVEPPVSLGKLLRVKGIAHLLEVLVPIQLAHSPHYCLWSFGVEFVLVVYWKAKIYTRPSLLHLFAYSADLFFLCHLSLSMLLLLWSFTLLGLTILFDFLFILYRQFIFLIIHGFQDRI